MRRLRSFSRFAASLAFVGLCVATAWISEYHAFHWGFSTLHGRYTFAIADAHFQFFVPPPARKEDAQAWELLKHLRNEDVVWMTEWTRSWPGEVPALSPSFKEGSAGWKLSRLSAASNQPLLRALDSPKKFVAAHVILADRESQHFFGSPYPVNGSIEYRGLHFHLRNAQSQFGSDEPGRTPIPDGALTLDPGQLQSIRNMWHGMLDRTAVSFNIFWIAGAAYIVLALQGARLLRRQRRLRLGQCVHCGYDLRASTD